MKLKNKFLIILLLFIGIFFFYNIKSFGFTCNYKSKDYTIPDDLIVEKLKDNELGLDYSNCDVLIKASYSNGYLSTGNYLSDSYDIDVYIGDLLYVSENDDDFVVFSCPLYRFHYQFSDLNVLSSSSEPYCELVHFSDNARSLSIQIDESSYYFPIYRSCDITSKDGGIVYFSKSPEPFTLFREAGSSGQGGNSGSTGSETNTTGDNTGNENTNTSGSDNTGSTNNNSFGKDDDSKNWLVSILENVFGGFFDGIISPIKQIFEFLGKVLSGIPEFFTNILDYLNPFSDNFILKKIIDFLGLLVSYINPFSDNFILSDVIDFLGRLLSYINPFSDNFFGIKLIELLKNLLQTLFIPEERLV